PSVSEGGAARGPGHRGSRGLAGSHGHPGSDRHGLLRGLPCRDRCLVGQGRHTSGRGGGALSASAGSSSLKLLLDEHYPPSLAEQLRERGHDAVAVQEEVDLRGMLDPDLFAEAQRRDCALLTENTADFIVLDAECRSRHSAHWGL